MSDYISREAAINAGWNALYKYEGETEKRFMDDPELNIDDWFLHRIFVQGMHNGYLEAVIHLPAADVREVVMCRDCKFWNRDRISCEGLARCNTGEGGIRYRNANDYCSRGADTRGEADGR